MRRHLTLEEISAWLDGEVELGEPEHRHLRECAECGAVLDGHQRLRRLARKAMPRVPTDAMWRGTNARLAPAPSPVVERAIPASRALIVRGAPAHAAGSRRTFRLRLRAFPPRARAFLAAVFGVIAVLLVMPRTPSRDAPGTLAEALRTVQARRGRITFELGRSTLEPASEPALREIASILARNPGIDVTVEGHTDNTGGTGWNIRMSRARAEAVVRWLVDHGNVAAGRLAARGFGSSRPVADNETEAGQDANRRVEFVVTHGVSRVTPPADGRGVSRDGGTPQTARKRPQPEAQPVTAPTAPAPPSAPPPAVPRPTYAGTRFRLTADRFTTASPDLISAAGHVRIEPANPDEPWFAVVDGFSRTLTGTATGIVAEVVNPGEHLILHTGTPGVPVHPVP